MPMHDWTKVDDGIFHAFHHFWISALTDVLNGLSARQRDHLVRKLAEYSDDLREIAQRG